MTQGMEAALFGYSGFFFAAYIVADAVLLVICELGFWPGKSHCFGDVFPVLSELTKESLRQDSIAVFTPLALLNSEHHS